MKKIVKADSGKEEEDEKILHEMFINDADQVSCAEDVPVMEKHLRIGEYSTGKNRLIRLIMRSSKERALLLRSFEMLKYSVCPDLSPEERKKRKSIVEQMKNIKHDKAGPQQALLHLS